MGKKRKVEVINISLDIDVTEEIKTKVDSLSTDIIDHTKELIKKNGMKIQRVSKKKQRRQENLEKAKMAVEFLEKAFQIVDHWCTGEEIMEHVGIEFDSQALNKFIMQVRKLLKEEDKWALTKRRRLKKSVYRLAKFS